MGPRLGVLPNRCELQPIIRFVVTFPTLKLISDMELHNEGNGAMIMQDACECKQCKSRSSSLSSQRIVDREAICRNTSNTS